MNSNSRAVHLFERIEQFELPICAFFNRANNLKLINLFFKLVSRLGDGVIWYCMIAATVLTHGQEAIYPAIQMLLTGGFGVLIYKILKQNVVRERPFITHDVIHCNTRPLDRYSFPSGHTLHAVSFSILLVFYYPELIWIAMPFAILVALSRFILGLHYISDVIVGSLIGGVLAVISLQIGLIILH